MAIIVTAGGALAQSSLRISAPLSVGSFDGAVYDSGGDPIGTLHVEHEVFSDGRARLLSQTLVRDRLVNDLEAELERSPGSDALRPVRQVARSLDSSGEEMVELELNHASGRARCRFASGRQEEHVLPADERIANVVMTIALHPLAVGDVEEVGFQLFLCEGWRRVVDVTARRAAPTSPSAAEIRFDFGLPRWLDFLIGRLLPDVRVWMTPVRPSQWLAHRLPLHPGGPEVVLVRVGLDPVPFLGAP